MSSRSIPTRCTSSTSAANVIYHGGRLAKPDGSRLQVAKRDRAAIAGSTSHADRERAYSPLHHFSISCLALSLAYPYFASSLPSSCSRLPLICAISSSVSLPHCCLALAANCFQFP